MACYLISYDLRSEISAEDYKKLYAAIKAYGTWAHILESTWAVVSNGTASDVFDDLVQYVDSNDGLIVLKTAGVSKWIRVQCEDSWLKDHI